MSRPDVCVNPACGIPLVFKPEPTTVGTRRHIGRGLCSTCYHRQRRAYEPTGTADEFVIDCVLTGESMATRPAERRVLIPELTRRGLPAAEIARRLRVDTRTVHRIRTQMRGTP
jgi:hypothetical protein